MKQCPRCKSVLAKSHGQKMICRACGFVTNNIEVARDNQQFQQRHHFGKKILHSKFNGNTHNNNNRKEFKDHYLMSFQTALRHAAINISKMCNEFKNIQCNARHIWMAYLNVASQHNVEIGGIFKKILKSKNKTNNKNQQQKQQQQEQEKEQQKLQQQDVDPFNQQNKLNAEINQQQQKQDRRNKKIKRRGRRKKDLGEGLSTNQQKKVSLKIQIRRKLLSIKQSQEQLQVSEQAQLFLSFIYTIHEEHIQQQTVNYIATKYAIFLIKNMRHFNLNIGVSEVKGRTLKLTTKQLQMLIEMRKLHFTQKSQMIIVLLLEDLLRLWAQEMNINAQYSLQKLLLLYKSPKNSATKSIIDITMKSLTKLMTKQEELKREGNDKLNKIKFPQLSLNLLYAIIYLSSLSTINSLTIDDIVLFAGDISFRFRDQQLRNEEKVNSMRVRKYAALLIRILNLKCQVSVESLRRWVEKYSKICGISQHIGQLSKLTQVLYKTLEIGKKEEKEQLVIQKRFEYLQQDIMAKSIIIIYVKLQIGFQSEPYLSTFPTQIINLIKQNKIELPQSSKFIPILENIKSNRGANMLQISKIINNIQSRYGSDSKRERELKLKYPVQNYSSLTNLTMRNLITLITRHNKNKFSFQANFVSKPKNKNIAQGFKILGGPGNSEKKMGISIQLRKQLEFALRDYEQCIFNYEDLDIPSVNYQFFYQYMSNVKHVNRDLFVLFAETLAARQCRMRQLYQWIQKFEKVLIDFQN